MEWSAYTVSPSQPPHAGDTSPADGPALTGARDDETHALQAVVNESQFTSMPLQDLRALCNRTYEALDADQPSLETVYLYQEMIDVLETREAVVRKPGRTHPRERFRDNQWSSTFELIRDGIVAGYVKYRIRGGNVALLHMVLDPRFVNAGVEASLVRHVILDLHHRRLAATSFCRKVDDFIVDHPELAGLVPFQHRHNDDRVIPLPHR